MNRCWICCAPLPPDAARYHTACTRKLFGTAQPPQLDYDWADLNRLAEQVVRRSIRRLKFERLAP